MILRSLVSNLAATTCRRTVRFPLAAIVCLSLTSDSLHSQESKPNETPAAKAPAPSKSKATPVKTNRLAKEKSPYLLQHKNNPVDWYPWGAEAFAKAKKENKPILLSVGYSTCHWCHVMEHESFEKEDVAELLNKHFVCIKLDREERPDIDRVYMQYLQATTGSGGWPMNVFMTPDKNPFFAGTYFPKANFIKLCTQVASVWENDQENLLKGSLESAEQFKKALETPPSAEERKLAETILESAYGNLGKSFDKTNAGFGKGQKFPTPVNLDFLLQYADAKGADSPEGKEATSMVLQTLDTMMNGGIFDHLGGGFHRYTVESAWHVPHFEKMLYDQGQLAVTYLRAYQLTGNEAYANVARRIFEYVERDLSHESGAFYSAEDADSLKADGSEKGEGVFYVWSLDEITKITGEDAAKVLTVVYGLRKDGNAPPGSDPHREFVGLNILKRFVSDKDTATQLKKPETEVTKLRKEAEAKLFAVREKRHRPHLDDKILTSWNGLMISAYATAAMVLGEEKYAERAGRATDFILNNLRDKKSGALLRSYREGPSNITGFAEDYSSMINALLDLYEATGGARWLTTAVELQEKQIALLHDPKHGGFFDSDQTEDLIARMKSLYDGAEPSPNSIAAQNLIRLANMLKSENYQKIAEQMFGVFAPELNRSPSAFSRFLCAYELNTRKPYQVVIAGALGSPGHAETLKLLHAEYRPNKVVLYADGGEGQKFIAKSSEAIGNMTAIEGKATLYLCQNFTCKAPTNDLKKIAELLKGM